MNILAFESSCDETAAAVARDGLEQLGGVVATQIDMHSVYGGVVPEVASRRHAEVIAAVADGALEKSGLAPGDIDAVAVTNRPGLIGALLVGLSFAKGVALSLGVPLVPVHHIKAHASSVMLGFPELRPPYICLVASGGHTSILRVLSGTDMRVLGATRDDAAGEALDKVGRALGMAYPAGAAMDAAAQRQGGAAYKIPRPDLGGSLDFSFSGLKTAALNHINQAAQRGAQVDADALAASVMHAVTDILAKNLLAASQRTGVRKVAIAGGVAASKTLRLELSHLCEQRGLEFYPAPPYLCGDNAAMVAAQGWFELSAGATAGMDCNAVASAPLPREEGF